MDRNLHINLYSEAIALKNMKQPLGMLTKYYFVFCSKRNFGLDDCLFPAICTTIHSRTLYHLH